MPYSSNGFCIENCTTSLNIHPEHHRAVDEADRVSVRGEGVPGVQAGVHRGRRLLEEVKKIICAQLQENVEKAK